jgi:hypothetical protein
VLGHVCCTRLQNISSKAHKSFLLTIFNQFLEIYCLIWLSIYNEQLLEIVNRSLKGPEDQQGLVVANDSDTDRAYMLGMLLLSPIMIGSWLYVSFTILYHIILLPLSTISSNIRLTQLLCLYISSSATQSINAGASTLLSSW